MLIVDCGSPRTPKIIEHVSMLGHRPCVVSLELLQPEHVEGMPGIIFSGSLKMITDQGPEFLTKYAFLREVKIPMLGICFGHQFLGALHGGTVNWCTTQAKGDVEIWLEDDLLFSGIEPVTAFAQDHEQQVSLPDGFVRIGSSNHTAVEAMRHLSKPIYSVQFHPESSGIEGFKLFENFVKLCTPYILNKL